MTVPVQMAPERTRDSLNELTEKDIPGAILNEPLENATARPQQTQELGILTVYWRKWMAVYVPTALSSLFFNTKLTRVRCLVQRCQKSRRSGACISGTVDDQNMQLAPAWTQKFKFSSIFIQLEQLIRTRGASASCKCTIAIDLYSKVPQSRTRMYPSRDVTFNYWIMNSLVLYVERTIDDCLKSRTQLRWVRSIATLNYLVNVRFDT